MATNVTFNGTSYAIPAAGELNWTSLSAFLLDVGQNAGLNTIDKNAIRVATTSPVTVSATTDFAVVTNLGTPGAVAVTLPAGVNGQTFVILDGKGDAATNNITITPNGAETINGAATLTLAQDRQSVILQYSTTGTQWRVLGSYFTTLANALANPMTTAGDIIYGGVSGLPTRLAVGATGTVLKGGTNPSYATIANADVDAAAAIAGTKISPSFGSQNISNTGTTSTGALTSTGITVTQASGSSHLTLTRTGTSSGSVYVATAGGEFWIGTTAGASNLLLLTSNGNMTTQGATINSSPLRPATGTYNALNVANETLVFTGVSGGMTINGMAGGVNGQILWIVEDSGNTTTITHQSASAVSADRFYLGGSSLSLSLAGACFVYSTGCNAWVKIKSV